MSGGHLAVLDRAGREVKQYALPTGLATLGSSSSCDIRFMLPTVEPHHATVVVHNKQTVVHNVGGGETLLNGVAVSVAPLAHGDVLAVGGRELRWRYERPHTTRRTSLTPVVTRISGVRARVAARRSLAPPGHSPHSPHRHSTPASERQVAVVQPQRRDAADNIVVSVVTNVRRRGTIKSDRDASSSNISEETKSRSKAARTSQMNVENTTKASMWIESRKSSPRKHARESPAPAQRRPRSAKKSTPLRLAVLRRAQSAHTARRVTKIQAPLTVDHTKQAAIMLMTGHTPKKRVNPKASTARTPSLVVKRPGATPARRPARSPQLATTNTSAQVIRTSDVKNATPQIVVTESDISTYSVPDTSLRSPPLPNPKKSALKNSSVNRSSRKIESIKFDLSNLEDEVSDSMDMSTASEAGECGADLLALRYSDSSPDSPSPPSRPQHSRSGRMLENTLGTTFTRQMSHGASSPQPQPSPNRSKSTRGGLMVHKVLQTPDKSCSYQTTDSLADLSWDTTATSRRNTRTMSPHNSSKMDNKMESYSVIDLVSMDSSDPRSVYSSASDASTSKLTTPQRSARRSLRSPVAPRLLAASTPAAPLAPRPHRPRSAAVSRTSRSFPNSSCLIISRRSKSAADSPLDIPHDATYDISGRGRTRSPLDIENIPDISTRNTRHMNTSPDHGAESVTSDKDTTKFSSPNNTGDTYNISGKSRRSKSFSTLKNSSGNVTSNVTRDSTISKSSRSRGDDDDSSPVSVASSSHRPSRSSNPAGAPTSPPDGMSTPENHNSPEEVSTPVLNIQSLLNSSRNVPRSRPAVRKTIGGRVSALRKRTGLNSKSFTFGTTSASRSRNDLQDDGDMTPKKTVKLVYEAVKNKHSTAKRPKSIRSVIDDLNDSDIVKQLFNSPVKRKLSQSMIEFSKKQLLGDETTPLKMATRNTIAMTGITSHDSPMERTPAITPEVFVSPLTTTGGERRNVSFKLRRWRQGTADASGRTTLRKSVKNDLTKVSGIKSLFARTPRNRLSDVRIKELFAASPENDLRRVPKLRLLFQESPENDLREVSGVRDLYRRRSPANDLRDVSGVRATLRRHSPRNELDDVSGVEELFSERLDADADADAETSFDLLMGKPAVRAYPRAKSLATKLIQKPKSRKAQSLLNSFTLINDNVEDWLENELKKRTRKESPRDAPARGDTSAGNANTGGGPTPKSDLNKSKSKSNLSRELLKLATDTVEGGSPVLARRARSTTQAKTSLELKKSASEIYGAHMLPIKKRSVVETSRSRSSGHGSGHKSSLPIKKRAVQHSTPVRRAPARLSAHHALALVSPIAPIAPIAPIQHQQDNLSANITSTAIPSERIKRKTLQTRKANVSSAAGDNKNLTTSNKLSPKQREKITSPMQMRNTRNRKTNHNMEQNNVKKRRTSIVVTKKPPGLSPKPVANQNTEPEPRTSRRRKLDQVVQENLTTKAAAKFETRGKRICAVKEANHNTVNGNKGSKASNSLKVSPPKTRTTRKRKASAEKILTPKKITRSKVLKHTVVVTKPSPNLKTRTAKQSKVNVSERSPVKNLRRTRKTNAITSEPPVEIVNKRGRGKAAALSVKQTENKKTKANDKSYNEDLDTEIKPRRGRKTIAQKNVQDESKPTLVQKRAIPNTVNLVEVKKNTRGKAAPQETIEPPKRRAANKDNTESVSRGKKRKTVNAQSPSKAVVANSTKDGNEESVKSGRRVAKGRQAQTQNASGTVDKSPVTVQKRGRTTNKGKEASPEKAGEVKVARRRNTARQNVSGETAASNTTNRSSKAAAKQKLLTTADRSDKSRVIQKTKSAAELRASPARKRKADTDPAPAKAGPPAPKTRRAAAASARNTRNTRSAPPVSQQAAARTRRR